MGPARRLGRGAALVSRPLQRPLADDAGGGPRRRDRNRRRQMAQTRGGADQRRHAKRQGGAGLRVQGISAWAPDRRPHRGRGARGDGFPDRRRGPAAAGGRGRSHRWAAARGRRRRADDRRPVRPPLRRRRRPAARPRGGDSVAELERGLSGPYDRRAPVPRA